MYECVQAGKDTFFMDCPSRVGIFRTGDAAWLIDSGNDKDAAKKVLAILEGMNLRLEAVIVTHYHADHTGGAALLQQRTGCRLMLAEPTAPGAFPEINTALLYGAHPPKPLKSKFSLPRARATRLRKAPPCPKACALRGWMVTPLPCWAYARATMCGLSATASPASIRLTNTN